MLTGGVRDLPERQQTLRAAIAWSVELLSEDEALLFGRLPVFAGSFSLDGAETVAGHEFPGDVLGALETLLEHSLVREVAEVNASPRYAMLETIREFGLELLTQRGEESAVRHRHLSYYLELAEQAYEQRFTSASRWIRVSEAEHDNIRAALDWARDRDPSVESQLLGAIAPYWYLLGHVAEARERLASALERYEARDAVRARALTQLGEVLWRGGQEAAFQALNEALELWRELGDDRGTAQVLERIGHIHVALEQHEAARQKLDESVMLRRRAGAPEPELAGSLTGLCALLVAEGRVAEAEQLAAQCLELGTRYDNRRAIQIALHHLADCALIREEYDEAEARYRRALAHAWAWRMTTQATNELLGVAMAAAGMAQDERAVRLAAVAYRRIEEMGLLRSYLAWWDALQERYIGGARASLGRAKTDEAERAAGAKFDEVLDELVEELRDVGASASRAAR